MDRPRQCQSRIARSISEAFQRETCLEGRTVGAAMLARQRSAEQSGVTHANEECVAPVARPVAFDDSLRDFQPAERTSGVADLDLVSGELKVHGPPRSPASRGSPARWT